MRLDEHKTTLADLLNLVGKRARYRTAIGWSTINMIRTIEITSDGIIIVLEDGVRIKRIRRRHISRIELVQDNEKPKPDEMRINRWVCTKCKVSYELAGICSKCGDILRDKRKLDMKNNKIINNNPKSKNITDRRDIILPRPEQFD